MRLADIFAAHWPAYRQRYHKRIAGAHHRAAEAILRCRTPALGGHLYRCPECGGRHLVYHSCNHRSCPQCGGLDQQRWAAAQQARQLPVDYFLLTFTLPSELRSLVYRHQKPLYELFFTAVAQSVHDLAADPQWLGGEAGFTAVLHTWTRQLNYHPHIHVLMPGVALDENRCRLHRPTRKDGAFLLPGNIAAATLRNRFKKLLRQRHSELYAQLPSSLWRQSWVAHVENAGRGTEATRYLAAYVAKSALSDSRLLGTDAKGNIRLRWFDRQSGNAPREMTLTPHQLITRVLLHVLPKGLMRVRHYGWLASAAKTRFARVRLLLGLVNPPLPIHIPTPAPCCPHCGAQNALRRTGTVPHPRGPPLEAPCQ